MLVFLPATVTSNHSSESSVNHLDNYRFGFQFGESLYRKGLRQSVLRGRGICKNSVYNDQSRSRRELIN